VKLQNFQGTYGRFFECYTGFLVYSYRNLRPRETSPASVPIRPKPKRDTFLCPSPPPSHLHGLDLPGSLLPQPHKLHNGPRAQRQHTQVMVPCSPCWAVYKTVCVFFSVLFWHPPRSSGRTPSIRLTSRAPQSSPSACARRQRLTGRQTVARITPTTTKARKRMAHLHHFRPSHVLRRV
jgi:hypothetical protein